jgi:hypothetical protein
VHLVGDKTLISEKMHGELRIKKKIFWLFTFPCNVIRAVSEKKTQVPIQVLWLTILETTCNTCSCLPSRGKRVLVRFCFSGRVSMRAVNRPVCPLLKELCCVFSLSSAESVVRTRSTILVRGTVQNARITPCLVCTVFSGEKTARAYSYSPSSVAEVKNERSYTSAPHICHTLTVCNFAATRYC